MVRRIRRMPDILKEEDPTMGFSKAIRSWEEKVGKGAKFQKRVEAYAVTIVFFILILYFLLKYVFNVL